ncbi:MAG: glycosyltransferase [Legionellales bacterium]|nr:glycosyltransferase [Legionellales bacterium]
MISVIIPSHDRKLLLRRALDSVLAQTYREIEIIVVDDGSTDGTAVDVRQRYPMVHLIEQTQHGVSHARNQGIVAAQGEWIALLDADDEWHPDKLTQQLQALIAQPEHRICHTDEIWIRHGKRVNPMRKHQKGGGWLFEASLPLCAISPSSVLLHKDVFRTVGYFDEALPACEDYDLWLRITAREPVLWLPQPYVTKYGGHADQLSKRYWGMDRFRIYALAKLLRQTSLTPVQYQATLRTLRHKLTIYQQGAQKRQKRTQWLHCHTIQRHLAVLMNNPGCLQSLDDSIWQIICELFMVTSQASSELAER